MFKRGKKFERGRSPLSPALPSTAINIYAFYLYLWLERG